MGKVLAINIGAERGIEKTSVNEVRIVEGWGLEGDAHGGDWDKQVSVLPVEALEKVPDQKKEEVFNCGPTENIAVSGIPLDEMTVGKIIRIGEAEIQILNIGKEVFKEHGRPYIVSREGRFGRVVKGGRVSVGDDAIMI